MPTWLDRLWGGLVARGARTSTTPPTARADGWRPLVRPIRQLGGRRIATSTSLTPYEAAAELLKEPGDPIDDWRNLDLGRRPFDKRTPAEMLEHLTNTSPEVSRALWDFLRFCNPGWEVRAVKQGNPDVEVTKGTQALNEFMDVLKGNYGSADVVIGRLFIGAWMRGGFFGEVVLGKDGKTPVDIATPDPGSVRFKAEDDPIRGEIWQLYQLQDMDMVRLDRPTVRYIPVDPLPGSPYGRSPAYPGLFACLFLLSILYDIRRVVSQQGYPRIDIAISLERLQQAMPDSLDDDPEALNTWIQGAIQEVADAYESLEPDDAYVHTDVITVNRPVGTVDSNSLGAIGGLITALERMSVRALKTMPLMMGITDGVSEANANRQWEIHVAGIKSLQHLGESLLEHLLSQALQSQGIPAVAQFRFSELRAAEMLRDEQVRQLNVQNTMLEFEAGWISQDEAAQKVVGHDAVEKQPRADTRADKEAKQAQQLAKQQAAAQAEAKAKADAAAAQQAADQAAAAAGADAEAAPPTDGGNGAEVGDGGEAAPQDAPASGGSKGKAKGKKAQPLLDLLAELERDRIALRMALQQMEDE